MIYNFSYLHQLFVVHNLHRIKIFSSYLISIYISLVIKSCFALTFFAKN